jgi:integrase
MLRRGELLGLRDSDIDLEHGAITIVGQAQGGRRTRTKTAAGRRTVDLGPAAIKLLREQQLARVPNPDGLLFPTRTGAPYEAHNFMTASSSPLPAPPASPSSPSTTSATPAPR